MFQHGSQPCWWLNIRNSPWWCGHEHELIGDLCGSYFGGLSPPKYIFLQDLTQNIFTLKIIALYPKSCVFLCYL